MKRILCAAVAAVAWCAAWGGTPLFVGISDICDKDRNGAEEYYAHALERCGHIPFIIPKTADTNALARLLARADAIVLTGGRADIDPALYGETRHPRASAPDPFRDRYDSAILRYAAAHRLPVLGICRGEQMMNVFFGGSMYQHVPEAFGGKNGKPAVRHGLYSYFGAATNPPTHTVSVVPGTKLAQLLGTNELAVASHHHQAVKRIAPGFRVAAYAPDGVVEAIESVDLPMIGVQFHPETVVAERPKEGFELARLEQIFRRLGDYPKLSVATETVWLDEAGVWDRMSAGHGRSWVCTNGQKMVMGSFTRGVGTCAPSALYLAVNGNAVSFEATVGQLYSPNRSKLTFRVYRERELAFETPVLDATSGPHRIKVDLSGARWVKLEAHGVEYPYSGTSVWGDARFEMKRGTRPADIATLSPQLGILTPPAGAAPRINGPACFGVRPGNPVIYRVPVTGTRPMSIAVGGLDAPGLEGLSFDAASQTISGRVAKPGEYPLTFRASNASGAAEKRFRLVVGEKIALTPPLGWNSWNAFADTVTAKIVMETADVMARLGLGDHGWTYLTIDDGWQISFKSGKPRRDGQGRPLSNELFPDMKALADYVHARGFKIGLYSSPGPRTCAGYEGSWMHEFADAKTYAQWGYDYLKHDWCSYGEVAFGEGVERWMYPYLVMGRALRESGRDIVHSICEYGRENVSAWGAAALGQCWRTTGDKFDFWEDVVTAMEAHESLWRYAGPGAWNDADMMLVGSTHWSRHKGTRLTPNEQYTHVSMWAMLAAPMMIGCDLREVDPFTLSLLTNDEVLDVSQDARGAAAAKIQGGDDWSCWVRPLDDGSIAAALVNLSPYVQDVPFDLKAAGLLGTWSVRDLWRQRDEGRVTGGYRAQVPGHATHLVRLIPGSGARLREGLADVRDNDWFRRIKAFRALEAEGCSECQGR